MGGSRKIDFMYKHFEKAWGHRCGECSNLREKRWDKVYRKCVVYGDSSSEATDWAQGWTACGMFCREYKGRPIVELVERRRIEPAAPMEGQLSIDGLEDFSV